MLNSLKKIREIRKKLSSSKASIGTWMQIPNSDIAEILSRSGFDWVTLDLEHGNFDSINIVDIFRSIELGGAAPLVRLPNSEPTNIKKILDYGASGIIIPNIENANQLRKCISSSNWPPQGTRGVGFSRANLFGKNFIKYKKKKVKPLVVAIIESKMGYENLDEILQVKYLDSIFIGPYDLSASFDMLGDFKSKKFKKIINSIKEKCRENKIPCGIHLVEPDIKKLKKMTTEFQFVAYSIDAQFILSSIKDIK